jgi:hypothetical protein
MIGFEALWFLKCLIRRAFFLSILILGDETTALFRNVGDTSEKISGGVCEFFLPSSILCRVKLDSAFCCTVQCPMSSSYRHFILQCFMLVSPTSCYPVAAFELWSLEIWGEINLYQNVGIHKNNWECIILNIMRAFPERFSQLGDDLFSMTCLLFHVRTTTFAIIIVA